MSSISGRYPIITISYLTGRHNSQRKSKVFTNVYAARRFYAAKLARGKDPQVTKSITAPSSPPGTR